VNGKIKFWGGLTAEVDGEGPALINSLTKIAKKQKIEIRYGCAAKKIIYENNLVKGVEVLENNKINDRQRNSLQKLDTRWKYTYFSHDLFDNCTKILPI